MKCGKREGYTPFLPGFRKNPGCMAGESGTQQLCRVAFAFAPNGISLTYGVKCMVQPSFSLSHSAVSSHLLFA